MIDPFVLLAPILLLGVIALLGFVGCNWVFGLVETHLSHPGPPPVFRSISTPPAYTILGTSVTINEPSGVTSTDVLLAAINTDHDIAVSGPSMEWKLIRYDLHPIGAMRQTLFYCVGRGGGGPYTFSLVSTAQTANMIGTILRYSGANILDARGPKDIDGGSFNNNSTPPFVAQAPSLNTTEENTTLVAFFGAEIDFPNDRITPPQPPMMDHSGTLGTGVGVNATNGLAVADEASTAPGMTGTRTATVTSTRSNAPSISQMIALRAALI